MDDQKVLNAFSEMKKKFPFEDYVDESLGKYLEICSVIRDNSLSGKKVLSIGSGACDIEAILSLLGYEVTAIDDLNDQWYVISNNKNKIMQFAEDMNINLVVGEAGTENLEENYFDVVLLIDLIEHLHESPRYLLNNSISYLKPGGIIVIETPNAARLVGRIKLLMGKSSSVSFDFLYWNIGKFRGHIREYTKQELEKMLKIQGLNKINSKTLNHSINLVEQKGIFKKFLGHLYKLFCLYPNFKDTIIVHGIKPDGWVPIEDSVDNFKKYNRILKKYDSGQESAEVIINKIKGLM